MYLEEIDQLLSAWKSRSESFAAGLFELRALPTYEILTGGHDGKRLELTGLSQRRTAPALAVLEQAWRDYGIFSKTIQAAIAMRSQVPRFSLNQQKFRDIELLLLGPSALVDDNGSVLTLQQLYDRMTLAYNTGRAGLLEIDGAWKRLDEKMEQLVTFLRTRQSETAAGVPELRNLAEALRPKVMSDPIGANNEFETRIQPVFAQAKARIEKLETQRRTLPDDLKNARKLLGALAGLCDENVALLAECRDKIAGFALAEQPVSRQRITDLSVTLQQLEKRAEAGQTDPVCLELDAWVGELGRLAQISEETRRRNNAPLELRRELRGRLTALRAKAHSKGASEDSKLVDIAQRAVTALYNKPTPIDEASRLVQQYESRLNGRG